MPSGISSCAGTIERPECDPAVSLLLSGCVAAPRFRRDYCPCGQLVAVQRKNPETGDGLLTHAEANEPENPRVKHASHDSELTKVFVQCDEYAPLAMGEGEDLCVAWVTIPFPTPDDIVPRSVEFQPCTTPDAGIQWQLQAVVSITNGSTRSWPTSRRA